MRKYATYLSKPDRLVIVNTVIVIMTDIAPARGGGDISSVLNVYLR